ncbi:MAG: hypothetical protein KKE76_16040 [Gammaproteobacteria bacterium]|nr:hypothetical protein [Gammaproteobacteria bacterium]
MNDTLWIVSLLFGFAVLAQTFTSAYRLRREVKILQEELVASTQNLYECQRRNDWLETHLEDLLDAAQLRSDDPQSGDKLKQIVQAIKDDAVNSNFSVRVSDI